MTRVWRRTCILLAAVSFQGLETIQRSAEEDAMTLEEE